MSANGKQPGIGGAPSGKVPDAAGPPKPPAGGFAGGLAAMPSMGKPIGRRSTSGAQYNPDNAPARPSYPPMPYKPVAYRNTAGVRLDTSGFPGAKPKARSPVASIPEAKKGAKPPKRFGK